MTNADVSFGEHPRFYIYGIPIARKKHKIGIIIISFIVILKIFYRPLKYIKAKA